MGKRSSFSLKLRLSRVFPSFQSCRSKTPSTLPQTPLPPVLPSKTSSLRRRHVSSAILPCGRSFRSSDENQPREYYTWQKEEQWHVVAKINEEETETPRKKIYNTSASAGDDDDDDTDFLNDDVLLLPLTRTKRRSKQEPITEKKAKKKKKKRETKRSVSSVRSPARVSVFKKVIPTWCAVEGKVRESYAVVKKSENPYEDFKRSMMEMIVEKKMFEQKDLEQLLHCFLSLNARDHHGVIVEAFIDIWDLMFVKNWSESDV